MPKLQMTEEQQFVLFYLFGGLTQSPCPACSAEWGSRVLRDGLVEDVITHKSGCRYAQQMGVRTEVRNEVITEPQPKKKSKKHKKKGGKR